MSRAAPRLPPKNKTGTFPGLRDRSAFVTFFSFCFFNEKGRRNGRQRGIRNGHRVKKKKVYAIFFSLKKKSSGLQNHQRSETESYKGWNGLDGFCWCPESGSRDKPSGAVLIPVLNPYEHHQGRAPPCGGGGGRGASRGLLQGPARSTSLTRPRAAR